MNKPIVAPKAKFSVPVRVVASPRGVPFWLVEDYSVPVVAMEFAAAGGASQDAPGKAGGVEMLAGLLDEGAGPYDSQAFHEKLDEHAVEISFHADRDNLSGSLRCLAAQLDRAQDFFALALNAPRFDEAPIARVREQLGAKLRQEMNDPGAMAGRAWRAGVFPGHAYGRPTDGTLDSLAAVSRADLAATAARILTRRELRIAVVGAVGEGRAGALVDAVFDALPATGELTPIGRPSFVGLGTSATLDLDVPQTTIRFGRPAIMRGDDDFIASLVVMHVLGGSGLSSRLFREVREKRGLAYTVHANVSILKEAAFLYGGTTTKNERARESLDVIQAEIRDLAGGGLTADEIDKGKTYLIGSYALRFDASMKIAHHLVQMQVEGYAPEWMIERNARIGAVTLADANRAAERLFADGSLAVTMVGRPKGR